MSTATVVVKFDLTPVPDGKTYARLNFALTDSTGAPQSIDVLAGTAPTTGTDGTPEYSVPFTNVAAGAVTAVVQAFDSDGNPLGSALTGTGTVAEPATFPQPTVVTVS